MTEKKSNNLGKERMQIYEVIFAMFIKFILVVAGLVAFFLVLFHIFNEKDNITKIIYGVFDTMLGGTVYLVYKHYFPDSKKQ